MKNTVKDLLKRPIQVGDTVLVNGYASQQLTELATVVSVSKDWAKVDIKVPTWSSGTGFKRMKRLWYQMIIVNAQLKENKSMGIDYDR